MSILKFFRFIIIAITVFASVSMAAAQKRDNLTDEEDLIVREVQEVDGRMAVFIKVIDRRLFALNDPNAAKSKSAQKDVNHDWGPLRVGTIGELFWDIQKTLDEAISKIDDIAERDAKNPLLGKSVHMLADGCKIWRPQFKGFLSKTDIEKERGVILTAEEFCDQIIEAAAKVPRDIPKPDKKKKN